MKDGIYEVPQANLAKLELRLKKLNKRADKLQLARVELSVVREQLIPIYGDSQVLYPSLATWRPVIGYETITHCQIIGAAPVVSGWQLIARLESLEHGNKINKTVDDIELPEIYRTRSTCDHCNTARRRKDTYVLRSEAGELKQIGRNCLADYLRSAEYAEHLAAIAELVRHCDGAMGDPDAEDFGGWGGRGERRWPIEEILTVASAAIRLHSWISRKALRDAGEGDRRVATADRVIFQYHKCMRYEKSGDYVFPCPSPRCRMELIEEDTTTGANTLAWIMQQPEVGDYLYNLHLIIKQGWVREQDIALISSAVFSYHRAMNQLREREAKPQSNHVGTVGEKLTAEVTLERISTYETYGAYGSLLMARYRFRTEDGNVLVWKTQARGSELQLDSKYQVTGTIKEHSDWKNNLETVLMRCTINEPEYVKPVKVKTRKKPISEPIAC